MWARPEGERNRIKVRVRTATAAMAGHGGHGGKWIAEFTRRPGAFKLRSRWGRRPVSMGASCPAETPSAFYRVP
ncbi:hypothetical protein GCM10027612_05370 [Microbispora bryophytorum subsp. camponoti]